MGHHVACMAGQDLQEPVLFTVRAMSELAGRACAASRVVARGACRAFAIDFARRTVTRDGGEVQLTVKEYRLLENANADGDESDRCADQYRQ